MPLDFSHANCRPLRSRLDRTNPNHIAAAAGGSQFATDAGGGYEVRPRGNSVSHEDEMMNVASNQMDYEAATELYTHSLGLIKLAIKELRRAVRASRR